MINIYSTSYNKDYNQLKTSLSNIDFVPFSHSVRVYNPKSRQFRDFKFDKSYKDEEGNILSMKFASSDGISLLIYCN